VQEYAPQEFEAYLWMHWDIHHQASHEQLQVYLVEHMWDHKVNQ
jgi:hypothetical protein